MVIPFLIEVNPSLVKRSAKMLLRAGTWKILASSKGKFKVNRPSSESIEFEGERSGDLLLEKAELVDVEILEAKVYSLTLLAERY